MYDFGIKYLVMKKLPIAQISVTTIIKAAFFLIICIKATDNKILQSVSVIISAVYLFEHGGFDHKYISQITALVDIIMIVMVLFFAFRRFNFFERNNIKIKDTLSDLGYWVIFLSLVICPIIMLDLHSFVFAFRSIVSVLCPLVVEMPTL